MSVVPAGDHQRKAAKWVKGTEVVLGYANTSTQTLGQVLGAGASPPLRLRMPRSCVVPEVIISQPAEIDAELMGWIDQAYRLKL